MTGVLILARQGQNEGEALERFVGQSDYRLTHLGRLEAKGIVRQILEARLFVDTIFAPVSRQSEETTQIIRKGLKSAAPVFHAPALGERDFGDLTNMRKEMALDLYGATAVVAWKRSFHAGPPSGESFAALHDRVWTYFNEHVRPCLDRGLNVLIVADTDSIRSLALGVGEVPATQMEALEFERGQVIAYAFEDAGSSRSAGREPPRLRIVA